ncbi:unnamed protein product [Urochloa decumbens]|uniref:Uncharacterized protein n=1 Tax=Urochloa decumbens TaxID=240449 RepID=A0ABC8YI56_9POAL
MAAVLDAFASKLADILMGMAKEEVEMLLGVPGEITKLETTLGDISSILGDAERRRIRDSAVERWVRDLKDVMYDADDILDLCQMMEGGEDPSSLGVVPKRTSRCWKIPKMCFCFRNGAHEIGRKIQALNQRLVDIEKRSSRFGFITQAINSSGFSINNATDSLFDKTGSIFIRSDVVGEKIEEDTKKIVDMLIKKVDAPARSKGNNDVVVAEFNEITVLQSVLASFGAKYEGFARNKDLLERALKDAVRQKKFLLVMDDVWSEKVWNELLRVPLSHGASGSRVLVTTRKDEVAHGMRAQYLHRVDKLQKEDAWILLKNQVVVNASDEAYVDGLKGIGMEIVERCVCLPLAVKAWRERGGPTVQDDISEEEHERIEDVLANLRPPTCTEILDIIGYFARGLPQWMSTMSAFGSLRRLVLDDYACCTQLPNGLGQLPFLDYFWMRAPSVQCIGHDFLIPSLGGEAPGGKGEVPLPTGTQNNKRQPHHTSRGAGGVAFPKLRKLDFVGMLGWTEWEWEQHVPAMPALEELSIINCKLQRLPAGLAQHACRLRELYLRNIQHLVSVENFHSLVKLWSYDNPSLERINNNPSLQWISISDCQILKELHGSPLLRSLEWWDLDAESLPEYLREAKLNKLRVDCSPKLLKLISLQDDSSEWGKIRHVQQVKVYGKESNEDSVDRHIFYTKEPYSFEAIMDESTDED